MEEAKQDINDISEKKSFVAWAKMHKKQLIIAGISIPSLAVTIFEVKRRDSIKEFWNSLKDEIGNAKLYSNKWFMKATDAELDVEREKVRLAYCSSKDNYSEVCRLQNLLWRFDKEMHKRAWGMKSRMHRGFSVNADGIYQTMIKV